MTYFHIVNNWEAILPINEAILYHLDKVKISACFSIRVYHSDFRLIPNKDNDKRLSKQ